MKSPKKFLPLLILVFLCAVLSASYLVLAQRGPVKVRNAPARDTKAREKNRERNERLRDRDQDERVKGRDNRPPRPVVEDSNKPVAGEQSVAMRTAVVNFNDLARASTNSPQSSKKMKDLDGPEEGPGDLPLPSDAIVTGKDSGANAPTSSDDSPRPLGPSPAPSQNFQGLPDGLVSIPPDTHGAVGPNHLMVTLNTQVLIQNRDGSTAKAAVTLDQFWSPLGNSPDTFDPKVLYDPYAQRWIITAVANAQTANSAILIGVSQTTDPTGVWFLYSFKADAGSTLWADYPSLGFNKDWIVVDVNMFTNSANSFSKGQVFVFNKANLYAHGNGQATAISIGSAFTLAPAITYDPNLSTFYLINDFNSSNGSLRLYTITGAVGSEVFTPTNFFPSSPTPWGGGGIIGPQAGLSSFVDTGDERMQNAVYRNGSIWCAQTVTFNGATGNRTAVQWWQINPANGGVLQRGTIDDPSGNVFYAYPTIAVNTNNDVLIGYSRYSTTQFVSANYSFRQGSDPLNALRTDVTYKFGEAAYFKTFGGSRNRWGDYSSTVVDPNDIDMWTVQEYASTPVGTGSTSSRWGTWWARVRSDGTPAPPAPTPTPPPPSPTPPANDNLVNAQVLTGCSGTVAGSNAGATREPNENTISGQPAASTLWYQWTATGTGSVTFDTIGSTFDTMLGVFTGNGFPLSSVGEDDDSGGNLTSRVTFNATSGTVYKIAVGGYPGQGSSVGSIKLNWTIAGCPPASSTVQFSRTSFGASENSTYALITVTRTGSTTNAASVDFVTSDGTAKQKTNYTIATGTVNFASGEATKTFTVLITDDNYAAGNTSLNLALSNPQGLALGSPTTATLTIVDNDSGTPTANLLDDARLFVQQHYFDFLSRVPDQGGLDYWTGRITECAPTDRQCLISRRNDVSNAFFFELEYQQTGAYTYRLYRAAYGNSQPFPNPGPDVNPGTIRAIELPNYSAFSADRARVIGGANQAQGQQSLADAFVTRPEFLAKYPASLSTGAQFVDAVLATLQNDLGVNLQSQRAALISQYDAGGRGRVMYRLADDNAQSNPINNRPLIDAEYNRAFVLTQYFGYLRRDPDLGGINFWLGILNQFPLRDTTGQHKMVCAFITSQEYQQRFSSVVTYANGDCP